MPRRKKSSTPGVLKGFHYDQPFIGFRSQFRSVPIGKGKSVTRTINYGGSCREELVWDAREYLQSQSVSWKKVRGTWRNKVTLTSTIDIDAPALKQPLVTYLWVNEEDWDGNYKQICRRACCLSSFPELLDAVAGPVAVLLNPDRYLGDWWTTSAKETLAGGEMRWYGTDNFFLRHPVLTSLMMGMFRQGVLLHQQGFDESILKSVKRKDIEDCLSNADPVLAMRILRRLRPWLEVTKNLSPHFAFAKGHWDRLGQLHKAIYKHGYDTLFDADIQRSWNIGAPETDEFGDVIDNDRYGVPNGPVAYWGSSNQTEAGKRLIKLGR